MSTEVRDVIGMLTVLVNLCLLALGLKLYTEFFKEKVKEKK